MITGNARKAKFTIAAWYPTSGMKDVKRKSLPASEKLINFLKILSTLEKKVFGTKEDSDVDVSLNLQAEMARGK